MGTSCAAQRKTPHTTTPSYCNLCTENQDNNYYFQDGETIPRTGIMIGQDIRVNRGILIPLVITSIAAAGAG